MSRWASLAGCLALCSSLACQREVTVHLLRDTVEATDADAGGDVVDASADDAASAPPPPCEKLGAEVCNGGDDDCNGLTDEGCDHTVVWTRQPDGLPLGHATGGVMFVAPCADGAVLTGTLVGMGRWLNQVVAVCRQVALHVDAAQSPPLFTATLGPRHDSSFAPATTTDTANQVHDLLCPDGFVVSGVDGTTTTDDRRYIMGIRLTCAPIVVTTAASGSVLDVDRTREQTTDTAVCATCVATQAFNYTMTVEPGHVATRLSGGDGLWVDRVGVGASLGSVTPR